MTNNLVKGNDKLSSNIAAITFDLWDTIVDDDSDEPKRAAQGLLSKRNQRRRLVFDALNAIEPIDESTVTLAYDTADAAYNVVWHDQHVTWKIEDRLQVILKGLGRQLPQAVFDQVVEDHANMEVDVEPNLIPGCAEALSELSSRYKLAIVSDAIVTPGRRLRDLLEKHGVKQYFSGFAFFRRGGQLEAAPSNVCLGCRAVGSRNRADDSHRRSRSQRYPGATFIGYEGCIVHRDSGCG